ncbi:hypothetical protein EVAR_13972_1 [Eumeta japonica]|uniref:Uncharacterized protein n=1 Tax=Eumeta variegata TaxID=151549 RepID=A0A4C1U8L6_EUMVA|nr:hypothetical protein EVAR_13972_1 [Eumeta japonica]
MTSLRVQQLESNDRSDIATGRGDRALGATLSGSSAEGARGPRPRIGDARNTSPVRRVAMVTRRQQPRRHRAIHRRVVCAMLTYRRGVTVEAIDRGRERDHAPRDSTAATMTIIRRNHSNGGLA